MAASSRPDNHQPDARINGWTWPTNNLQVTAWGCMGWMTIFTFLVAIPHIAHPYQIIAYVFLATIMAMHLVSHLIAITVDPSDANLRAKLRKSRKITGRPRTGHHIIENQYCFLCELNICGDAKHCSFCNKCIIGFDHHCKWLNNCIGERNYRYFIATIATAAAGATVIFSICLMEFTAYWIDADRGRMLKPYQDFWDEYDRANGTTTDNPLLPEPEFRLFYAVVPDEVWLLFTAITGVLAALTLGLTSHLLIFHFYLNLLKMSNYDYINRVRNKVATNAKKLESIKIRSTYMNMRLPRNQIEMVDLTKTEIWCARLVRVDVSISTELLQYKHLAVIVEDPDKLPSILEAVALNTWLGRYIPYFKKIAREYADGSSPSPSPSPEVQENINPSANPSTKASDENEITAVHSFASPRSVTSVSASKSAAGSPEAPGSPRIVEDVAPKSPRLSSKSGSLMIVQSASVNDVESGSLRSAATSHTPRSTHSATSRNSRSSVSSGSSDPFQLLDDSDPTTYEAVFAWGQQQAENVLPSPGFFCRLACFSRGAGCRALYVMLSNFFTNICCKKSQELPRVVSDVKSKPVSPKFFFRLACISCGAGFKACCSQVRGAFGKFGGWCLAGIAYLFIPCTAMAHGLRSCFKGCNCTCKGCQNPCRRCRPRNDVLPV